MDKQYTFTKEENKDKETVLTVKVSAEKFLATKTKVYNKLKESVKLPGFRPGKAPQALIEAHISEQVYNETINKVIPEVTGEILDAEKLSPMNQINYEFVKMSDAEGLEYKATFINYPEIKLSDFSKIKVKREDKKIGDKEVTEEIKKIMGYYKQMQQKNEKQEEGKDKEDKKKEDDKEVEITDEAVKSLGIGFETVAALKEQVQKELETMNSRDNESKWLQSVLDEAIKQSKISVPQKLVSESVAKREEEYLKKLEDLKLKPEEFLKMQNTTMEKLRSEWENEAKKKFSEELLLLEIIKAQELTVTESDINTELTKVTDEKLKKELDTPEGKRYIITVLLQQKAIEWLRNQVK